jgi:hypothetical protein
MEIHFTSISWRRDSVHHLEWIVKWGKKKSTGKSSDSGLVICSSLRLELVQAKLGMVQPYGLVRHDGAMTTLH